MTNQYATIFDIKRYALHDGPAIRTTVFFKGCPLNCHWCHNPEGIDSEIKTIAIPSKCISCNECVENCPEGALQHTAGTIHRKLEKCIHCQNCVATCPALAHEPTGRIMSIDALMTEIKKDLPFYDQSDGGITCSGGEPLSQPESLLALLKACGELGIHRAVDTSGFAPTDTLLQVSKQTDLFLFDLKHMDSRQHRHFTGVANELILQNLQTLSGVGIPIRVRIPLISGVNSDEENIRATGALAAQYKTVEGIDVLPYHPSANGKYKKLDMTNRGNNMVTPDNKQIAKVVQTLQNYKSDVRIGG